MVKNGDGDTAHDEQGEEEEEGEGNSWVWS